MDLQFTQDIMKLEIPNTLIESAGLKEDELKSALAVQLFLQGRLDREQASQLCGCSQDRLKELAANLVNTGGVKKFDTDEFLSWASHDLKTPLNSIIGFSRIILKGIDGPVSELQAADLALVNASGYRMLTLLDQLVEIAHLNRSEVKTKLEQVQIMPVIEEGVENWKQKRTDHELVTNFSIPKPGPFVHVDSYDIRQVVTYLLTYAGLHLAPGGKIVFNVEAIPSGLSLTIKSSGTRSSNDVKMDATILNFICKSYLILNGAELELCQSDENGAHIRLLFKTI